MPEMFLAYGLLVPNLGLCLPFVLSMRSRRAPAGLSQLWCVGSTWEEHLGSTEHNYPSEKQGHLSLHLRFHCAASVRSYLIFGPSSYRAITPHVLPCTSLVAVRQ